MTTQRKSTSWVYIAGWAMNSFVLIGLFSTAMAKLIKEASITEELSKVGLGDYVVQLGIFEIILIALFLIPKTANIGFIFLCSYVGGIIATQLIIGQDPTIGIWIATLLFVGVYLRKPSLFDLSLK